MSLTEFDIIAQYFTRPSSQASVDKSIGDDCAILTLNSNKRLVMSMDTMVEGRHFPESAEAFDIATRALCTSLSDLAAMGAKPLWFTLGLTLPSVDHDWLANFSRGLFSIADQFAVDLIGGDTTQGPLTITIQVHGEIDAGAGLMRSQAKVGDAIYVTGHLGDGAAALELLLSGSVAGKEVTADVDHYLRQRFYSPLPQITTGMQVAALANAAIDISDGLVADVEHIAKASGVQMMIHLEQLPIAPCLQTYDESRYFAWALSGGDDYQLLFTADKTQQQSIDAFIAKGTISATKIGEVCENGDKTHQGNGVILTLNGLPYEQSLYKGYQHFAS